MIMEIEGLLSIEKIKKMLKRTFDLFKQTKLGTTGMIIIAIFGLVALLAPLISPYAVDYLAPDQDVFTIAQFGRYLPSGEGYHKPVVGPTTPKYTGFQGGLWLIVANEDGHIYMDYMTQSFTNETPFEIGNYSISIDIQEISGANLTPPLSEVLYLVPGQDVQGHFGDNVEDGLLVFVANRTLVLYNPFTDDVWYTKELTFTPKWVLQDPASAGQMYSTPTETRITFFTYEGPYRYLVIADGSNLLALEVQYLYNIAKSKMQVTTVINETLEVTHEPLPYYNQEGIARGAQAQGIFVPTNNSRILVYNVTGGLRNEVDLYSIFNESVNLTAPIGFTRTTYPYLLYLPIKTATKSAVTFLESNKDKINYTFVIDNPNVVITTSPEIEYTIPETYIHFGANIYEGTTPENAKIYRVLRNATEDKTFIGEIDEPVKDVFYVKEVSKVFALGYSGTIYAAVTTVGTAEREGVTEFFATQEGTEYIVYTGSMAGTIYGTLSNREVYGAWMNTLTGEVRFFQFLGDIVTPLPPGKYSSGNTYILGTDFYGGDILTQLIYGTQIAFLVGILSALSSVFIGTIVGITSGYFGKLVDSILMRVTDIFLVLPFLPIVLILTAIMGPSIWNIVIVIALLGWPGIARVIRAQTLSLKERPFIDAARIAGANDARIIFAHIAPNVLPFTFLYMTLGVAGAIITEAALSFLGFGDPVAMSWGRMLYSIQVTGSTLSAPWWLLPPGVAITLLSLGFYLVGKAYDEIVNPRLRRR